MNPRPEKPEVAIVGLGYVGLTTAACLASRGFTVHGVDVDSARLAALRRGALPIHEPGLGPLIAASLRSGRLSLEDGYGRLGGCEVIFITVGTPSRQDGSIDTRYVAKAALSIGRSIRRSGGRPAVVVKSTVVPGTTEGVVVPALERGSGKKAGRGFWVAVNPEFLAEGTAVKETLDADGLVIGASDGRAAGALKRLYHSFYGKLPPLILTSIPTAEAMKYAINTARASQLSLINTVANVCSRTPGCDYGDVRKGLSLIARMDERYLGAGLGFGGSCLPKDARALAAHARSLGVDDSVLAAALAVNERQPAEAVRAAERLAGPLSGKQVAVLGLAFKARTDDVRESVAVRLVRELLAKGCRVSVYDPEAMANARGALGGGVRYSSSAAECMKGSTCCFVATGWEEFKRLKASDFKRAMAEPVVVDGRRILDWRRLAEGGVAVAIIGTGPMAAGGAAAPRRAAGR